MAVFRSSSLDLDCKPDWRKVVERVWKASFLRKETLASSQHPGIERRILDERKMKKSFVDWIDFVVVVADVVGYWRC